jgi:hypothetical protein
MAAYCPSVAHKAKCRLWVRLRLSRLFRIRVYFDCIDCDRIFSKRLKQGDKWTWHDSNFCSRCR